MGYFVCPKRIENVTLRVALKMSLQYCVESVGEFVMQVFRFWQCKFSPAANICIIKFCARLCNLKRIAQLPSEL